MNSRKVETWSLRTRNIPMGRYVVVLAALTISAACSTPMADDAREHLSQESSNPPTGAVADEGYSRQQVGGDGLFLTDKLEELVQVADLVIIGEAVDDERMAFSDNQQIPVASRSGLVYEEHTYHDVTVDVEETLTGPEYSTVSVRRRASSGSSGMGGGGDVPAPEVGKRYLFLLFPGEGIWTGGHLVLLPNGMMEIDDEGDIHNDGEKVTTLRDLRQLIENGGS